MRALLFPLILLSICTAGHSIALEGDRDTGFGANGQLVIVRSQRNGGISTQPTGDLDVLEDGRFIWTAPLEDGSIWVGRAWRSGAADAAFGSEGIGRIALPGCGPKRNVRLIADSARGAYVWSSGCIRHILDDGALEPGFGSGTMPAATFVAADLARDPAGGLVLAGRDGLQVKVYRFDQNGSPDMSFGGTGSVEVAIPSTSGARNLQALVIRPDGRILIGGSRANIHGSNLVVVQLLASGLPDPMWGVDGVVDMIAPTGFNSLTASALAIDEDGTLVVAGKANNGQQSCCILLARLDETGQVATSFGLRLQPLPEWPGLSAFGEQRDGLVILPNHRIIVATTAFPIPVESHRTQYILIRTFPDGSLDPAFGHDGWNNYAIADPDNIGRSGDYNQIHAIGNDVSDGSLLMFGRTDFEEDATGTDYVSMVRARFDLIFDARFEEHD